MTLGRRNHDLPLGDSGHTPGGKEPGDTASIGTVKIDFTFAMERVESLRQLRVGNQPDLNPVCVLILTQLYLYPYHSLLFFFFSKSCGTHDALIDIHSDQFYPLGVSADNGNAVDGHPD